jgi:hypothetical protein
VLFPLDGESIWPRNSTHPVTRPNSYISGGGVCFRLGSGRQERIKLSVRVLSLGGTENGGRCPSTVIENRTGGRKRRRNDHPSV